MFCHFWRIFTLWSCAKLTPSISKHVPPHRAYQTSPEILLRPPKPRNLHTWLHLVFLKSVERLGEVCYTANRCGLCKNTTLKFSSNPRSSTSQSMGICTCNLLCWSASYLWLQKSQRSLWSQQLRLCVLRVLPSACYYNVARNEGFEVHARNGILIMVLFGMCLPWFQCGAAKWRPFFLRAQNGQNELCFWLRRVHLDRSDIFMKKIVDTRHMMLPRSGATACKIEAW